MGPWKPAWGYESRRDFPASCWLWHSGELVLPLTGQWWRAGSDYVGERKIALIAWESWSHHIIAPTGSRAGQTPHLGKVGELALVLVCRSTDGLTNSATMQALIRALSWPTTIFTPSKNCWSMWRDHPRMSMTQGNNRISKRNPHKNTILIV